MIGGLLKSASRLALVAAAGVIAGGVGAQAADLGGNCCADLEERVAELEATTARKGTRRMGLQIYGQVSEVIMFWDDGAETNTYVNENNAAKNRFGAQGTAKINSDWSAGFKMEWQVRAYRSSAQNQLARGENNGLTSTVYNTQSLSLRHAYWFLRSETFGYLGVGQQDDAASGVLSINLAAPDGFAAPNGGFAMGGFFLRRSGTTGNAGLSAITWGNSAFMRNGDGPNSVDYTRATSIRYNTPTFAGFTGSASWGEDDMWSVALRYAGDLGAFRVAAGVAYSDWRDDDRTQCTNLDAAPATPTVTHVDCNAIQAGGSIMHTPTGLYVSGGWGRIEDNNRQLKATLAGMTVPIDNTDTYWWVQVGWEAKLVAIGRTTFWADYEKWENGLGVAANNIQTLAAGDVINPGLGAGAKLFSSEAESWGIGVTQDIDAAAMKLYFGFRNYSTDLTLSNAAGTVRAKSNNIDDFQLFYTGATVRF
jgi:hypothetical protein